MNDDPKDPFITAWRFPFPAGSPPVNISGFPKSGLLPRKEQKKTTVGDRSSRGKTSQWVSDQKASENAFCGRKAADVEICRPYDRPKNIGRIVPGVAYTGRSIATAWDQVHLESNERTPPKATCALLGLRQRPRQRVRS